MFKELITKQRRINENKIDLFFEYSLFDSVNQTELKIAQVFDEAQEWQRFIALFNRKIERIRKERFLTREEIINLSRHNQELRYAWFSIDPLKQNIIENEQINIVKGLLNYTQKNSNGKFKITSYKNDSFKYVICENGRICQRKGIKKDYRSESKAFDLCAQGTDDGKPFNVYFYFKYTNERGGIQDDIEIETIQTLKYCQKNKNRNVKFVFVLDGDFWQKNETAPKFKSDKIIITNTENITKYVNNLNSTHMTTEMKKFTETSKIDPTLIIDKIGGTYKPYQAFVELVDNSIDADASIIKINYDEIDHVLTIKDNGSGISAERITEVHNYGFGKHKETKIGEFNVGLKMVAPFLTNVNNTDLVEMQIDTVCNHKRTCLVKVYDINHPIKYLDNEISQTTSTEKNRTIIRITPVFFNSQKEIEEIINKLGARYHSLITSGKVRIYYNGKEIEGVDMFYRNLPESLMHEETVICTDEAGEFPVRVAIYDVSRGIKVQSDTGGNKKTNKSKLNKLDVCVSNNVTAAKYRGIYFMVNGVYLTLGGAPNSTSNQFGRELNTVSNGLRIIVEIPDSRKHYVYFPFKTETNKGLKSHYYLGEQVFKNVIDVVRKHNPTKEQRVEMNQDKKKNIRNTIIVKRNQILDVRETIMRYINEVETNTTEENVQKLIEETKEMVKLLKFIA